MRQVIRSPFLPLVLLALFVSATVLALVAMSPAPQLVELLQAAAALPAVVPWQRKREPMKTFDPVGANQTAYSKIPRYPRTILGFLLQLGGTTFTKALISRIELKLGERTIWGPVSGTQLQRVNTFVHGWRDDDATVLALDFTLPNVKELGGEMIGGLDLKKLPAGDLILEVEIGAATAPTLRGDIIWSQPQGESDLAGLMLKLIRRTYPEAAAGEFFPDIDLKNALICRNFMFHTVIPDAVVTAQSAGVANTGNGTFVAGGGVNVAAGTPLGRYHARCIEPAANAGRFAMFDPWGRVLGTFNVATAFDFGGLSGTLADDTDFVAGDGFTIDVGVTGNLTRVQVYKNEDVRWDRTHYMAQWEQSRFGRTPLAGLYVIDHLLDNHIDSALDTRGARAMDYRVEFTAADTLTLISQVLARPTQF